jgi:intracellular sulfur oxidation DsrE/DsrF family protein
MKSLIVSAMLVALSTPGAGAAADPAPTAQTQQADAHAPRILLVAFSGPEDAMRLTAPFHHAVLLEESHAARDVAIVVYGRAVAAVVASVKGVPPQARQDLDKALKAGVKVYACAYSLEMAGFGSAPLIPGVEKVPAGAIQVARLVGQGYVPLQY